MNRQVIVVLGMHRSGTSAVTRGLKALGVELGERLIGPRADNPTGFWENKQILHLNILLLNVLGLKWDRLSLIPPFQWQHPLVKELQAKAVRVIQESITSHRLWGFKDPRTLRVLPFWIETFKQLKVTPKYLVVVRNPISVARSLYERDGIAPRQSYLLWSIHVIPYLAKIRNQLVAVVDYDLLMDNPVLQLRRIASRLGIPGDMARMPAIEDYARVFLSQDLRHSRYAKEDLRNDPDVNDVTMAAYHWLHKLAHDEVSPAAEDFWREWSGLENQLLSGGPDCCWVDQPNQQTDSQPSNNPRIIHGRSQNSIVRIPEGTKWLMLIRRGVGN